VKGIKGVMLKTVIGMALPVMSVDCREGRQLAWRTRVMSSAIRITGALRKVRVN
jgi:hypothetical protein